MIDSRTLARAQDVAAEHFVFAIGDRPWSEAALWINSLGAVSELTAELIRPNGGRDPVPLPSVIGDVLSWLRDQMAADGHGAWLSARLVLTRTPDGAVDWRYDFNYDVRPTWHLEPDDLTWIEDLERYPRPTPEIPAWYPRRS